LSILGVLEIALKQKLIRHVFEVFGQVLELLIAFSGIFLDKGRIIHGSVVVNSQEHVVRRRDGVTSNVAPVVLFHLVAANA